MNEKQVENKLTAAVKRPVGLHRSSCLRDLQECRPSDLTPDGHIAFAELKAPGKLPRPLQLSRHRLLQRLGFKVYVIDDPEQIGGMLNEIRTT